MTTKPLGDGMPAARSGRLLAGHLIDGSGGAVRRDQLIRFRDGRIVKIEQAGLEGWEDEPLLDFSHCTVLPGLIDAHVHLALSGTADERARARQLQCSAELLAQQARHHMRAHLDCGIIAVRDAGDRLGVGLRSARSATSPLSVRAAGRAWHRQGRYGRFVGCAVEGGRALSEAVSRQCGLEPRQRPDQIKIVQSGLNSLRVFGQQAQPQFTLEELAPAVSAAAAAGLGTMAHASGRQAVTIALDAGVRSLEHGFFMGEENLQRLAERAVAWVPTAGTMLAYAHLPSIPAAEAEVAQRTLEHQLGQIGRALALGVQLVAGTDSGSPGVEHGRALHAELGLFIAAGCSVTSAVRCATADAAALLDLADRGRIAPGCRASLLAVPGPPEALPESLAHIACFVADGEVQALGAGQEGIAARRNQAWAGRK